MIIEKLVDLFIDVLVWVLSLGQDWRFVAYAVEIYLFLSMVYIWYLGMTRILIAKKENPEDLTRTVIFFAAPWSLFGLIADAVLGTVFGSIIFLQLPSFKRILFTDVLSYNAVHGAGYRLKLARWFCGLLDWADWGRKHCACWEGDEALKCQD